MRCRRCLSTRLLRLDKRWPPDNDVYRCQECGFLFSPSSSLETGSLETGSLETGALETGAGGPGPVGGPSRTAAVHSGYRTRE